MKKGSNILLTVVSIVSGKSSLFVIFKMTSVLQTQPCLWVTDGMCSGPHIFWLGSPLVDNLLNENSGNLCTMVID